MIILDLILCLAVIAMVVTPLAWAIRASLADERAGAPGRARFRPAQAETQRARGRARIGESIRPTA
jgi:hypothetical protein